MKFRSLQFTVLFGALALSACVTPSPEEMRAVAQTLPGNHRAQIKAKLRTVLLDPYSIGDAEISEPTAIYAGMGNHLPGVCIRFNAKNQYGAYDGLKTYAVSFKNGQAFHALPPMYRDCTKVTWRPFPEIMGR
ncbi:hypothetical protein [Sinorhizobium meliloti]|uniref:hypothetical protein n=1 Tax=Rhizobium meliloti TaxID=382 RepID=UPI000FD798E6|nr:hypothetical protein [Sinorhizobium meliloti]RVH25072.1 hypothetical protein CN211_30545 [Sinorhizobium meliloti]